MPDPATLRGYAHNKRFPETYLRGNESAQIFVTLLKSSEIWQGIQKQAHSKVPFGWLRA